MTPDAEIIKFRLVDIFEKRVLGRKPDISAFNPEHDGKAGNWLEMQFGKNTDADNHADFWGFELKNETSSGKTTFGDWSPNYCIYKDREEYGDVFLERRTCLNQDLFCRFFGKPNAEKNNRCSWSGEPVPNIWGYNAYGQLLVISENFDISIYYSFSHDTRINKFEILPTQLQKDNIILAQWFGLQFPAGYKPRAKDKLLRDKLEGKFNQNGWFKCKTDSNGVYDRICFGLPITFEQWINLIKQGHVYLDSGMHEGNSRPYQSWRANNTFWDTLIYDEFNKLRIDMNHYCVEHRLAGITIDEYLRRTKNE